MVPSYDDLLHLVRVLRVYASGELMPDGFRKPSCYVANQVREHTHFSAHATPAHESRPVFSALSIASNTIWRLVCRGGFTDRDRPW